MWVYLKVERASTRKEAAEIIKQAEAVPHTAYNYIDRFQDA